MDEGLLSEILTVEHDIRRRIHRLKDELAAAQAQLRQQCGERERQENARWEAECAARVAEVAAAARGEADALMAESAAYAAWLDALDDAELDQIVCKHLDRVQPEHGHDRPDE